MKLRQRKMIFNGNEIVFEDAPTVGVAGISSNMPDELAEMIVKRWNDAEPCEGCHKAPVDCPGTVECPL